MDKIADAIALMIMKGSTSPNLAYTYFGVEMIEHAVSCALGGWLIYALYQWAMTFIHYEYGPRPKRQQCTHCGRNQ